MYKRTVLLLGAMLLMGCEKSRTIVHPESGKTVEAPCIGIGDTPPLGIEYEFSTRNVILDVIFVETVVVPIWSVMEDIRCPVRPAVLRVVNP